MTIRPLGAALGAAVESVDQSPPVERDVFAVLRQAFLGPAA